MDKEPKQVDVKPKGSHSFPSPLVACTIHQAQQIPTTSTAQNKSRNVNSISAILRCRLFEKKGGHEATQPTKRGPYKKRVKE